MSGEEFYALPEVEQRLQVAAWEAKGDVCPEHGGPRSECESAETKWFPQRTVCHATMERAAAEWGYDQTHEAAPFHDGTFTKWSATRTLMHPYHYRDGVRIWVAPVDLNPHDHFLGSVEDCEVCTSSVDGLGLSATEVGGDEGGPDDDAEAEHQEHDR